MTGIYMVATLLNKGFVFTLLASNPHFSNEFQGFTSIPGHRSGCLPPKWFCAPKSSGRDAHDSHRRHVTMHGACSRL